MEGGNSRTRLVLMCLTLGLIVVFVIFYFMVGLDYREKLVKQEVLDKTKANIEAILVERKDADLSMDKLRDDYIYIYFTESFFETRKKFFESIDLLIGEPYKKKVVVENVWSGCSYYREFGDDKVDEKEIIDKPTANIGNVESLNDSTANLTVLYNWGNGKKKLVKTIVLVYDKLNARWLIDDLITNGKSQKQLDIEFCQKVRSEIEDYYKNWSFAWQSRSLYSKDGGEIPVLTSGGTYVYSISSLEILGENEDYYKVYNGFVPKDCATPHYNSQFSAESNSKNPNYLRVTLIEPNRAAITYKNHNYIGTFSTKGAYFSFHCDSLDTEIKGRFEDIYTLIIDKPSLKSLGLDEKLAKVTNTPPTNNDKPVRRTSRRETCWYCGGVGQAVVQGIGYTLCPACHGTGFLKSE